MRLCVLENKLTCSLLKLEYLTALLSHYLTDSSMRKWQVLIAPKESVSRRRLSYFHQRNSWLWYTLSWCDPRARLAVKKLLVFCISSSSNGWRWESGSVSRTLRTLPTPPPKVKRKLPFHLGGKGGNIRLHVSYPETPWNSLAQERSSLLVSQTSVIAGGRQLSCLA